MASAVTTLVFVVACAGGEDSGRVDATAEVVELPGAGNDVDFDDIAYAPALDRMVLPARDEGLYLVEPDSGDAQHLVPPDRLRSADSADEGRGNLFVVDRDTTTLAVINPTDGRLRASVIVGATPDYVRYIAATDEVWVTEPTADGIEVFAVPDPPTATPRQTGFISVPDGPEGITIAKLAGRTSVFTHAGSDLVVIDAVNHTLQRWPTGCDGTHGFPRVDPADSLVLASCANDGRVVLLDAATGEQLDTYDVGDGESLPAWSDATHHFYVRSDPGTTLATLDPGRTGLTLVRDVDVPAVGHCIGADDHGHYWTCDAVRGRLLRFSDPPN